MTLPASGNSISLYQIKDEADNAAQDSSVSTGSAFTIDDADIRLLISGGRASGAASSFSDFFGLSGETILWEVGITLGTGSTGGPEPLTVRGYNPDFSAGATTDSSCNLYSNTPTWKFSSIEDTNTVFSVNTTTGTPTDNNGWTKLKIYNGTNASGTLLATLLRTSLNYTTSTGIRSWNLGANYTPASGNRYLVFTT